MGFLKRAISLGMTREEECHCCKTGLFCRWKEQKLRWRL